MKTSVHNTYVYINKEYLDREDSLIKGKHTSVQWLRGEYVGRADVQTNFEKKKKGVFFFEVKLKKENRILQLQKHKCT